MTAFLCGSAENEEVVGHLFDHMICLVADNETIRNRLETRTTIAFGKHPEELAAALGWNDDAEARYQRLGATISTARGPRRRSSIDPPPAYEYPRKLTPG